MFANSPEARNIARKINHIFSFTQMGATSKGFINLPVPSAVTLQGRTYHYLPPTKAYEKVAFWYLLDSEYRKNSARIQELIEQDKLPPDFVSCIVSNVLEAMKTLKNPFYASLKETMTVTHKDMDEHTEQIELIIHPQDKPTGIPEIASIREAPTLDETTPTPPRTIIAKWITKGRKKKVHQHLEP